MWLLLLKDFRFWLLSALLVAGATAGVQTLRLGKAKAELVAFVSQTAAAGEAQKAANALTAYNDLKRKEKADEENRRTVAALRASVERLRSDFRPGGGAAAPAPAGSKCPDGQACFDRAEYLRADGVFVEEARGIADSCTAMNIDLDTAKRWAQDPR